MTRSLGACCALICACCLLLFSPQSQAAEKPKPPRAPIDLVSSPFQNSMDELDKKIDKKLKGDDQHPGRMSQYPDCAAAIAEPEDPNDKHKKHQKVAKACKLMQARHEKVEEGTVLNDDKGRKIGRKIKKVHTVYFEHPRDRVVDNDDPALPSKWDKFTFKGRPNIDLAGKDRVKNPSSVRVNNASLPVSNGVNDDFDCIDRATNKHLPGSVKDESGNVVDHPCYSDFNNRVLKATLEKQADETYRHPSGMIYSETEYQELPLVAANSTVHTTLQELIDEDGSVGASLGVDDDDDGEIDEDAPSDPAGAAAQCVAKGGVPDSEADPNVESCDFTGHIQHQLFLKEQELKAENKIPKNKKFFKMDDQGNCLTNAEADGDYPCGEEPREVDLEETIVLRCGPKAEYDDDGRCRMPNELQPLAAAYGAENIFASTTSTSDYAMMGFTFAPPVLEWGINERWRVCIFGYCFEVFAIRFGYEFDVAAGLRLPVEVTVKDVPTEVIAEESATLPLSLEPKDFRVDDYTLFCNTHHLDSDWWIRNCGDFAFPEYFASMLPDGWFEPSGNRQGSEFVAQTSIFAGLQIRVFSVPVVDYAIDSNVNIPAMCTIKKIKEQLAGNPAEWLKLLASFGKDVSEEGKANAKLLIKRLEEDLGNCATFTTPWGEENGEARQFPFLETGLSIPADCTKAKLEAVAVGGDEKPMCTGLKVNIYGATLGMGLELVPEATSDLVTAIATGSGDAKISDGTINFHYGAADPTIAVGFDNYDLESKTGTVSLDDFTYHLNKFIVKVNGIIELGGILSFIGDVAKVPLIKIGIDVGTGFPIPQHPGTEPIAFSIPVTNYALGIEGKPDTLAIRPGTPGTFGINVTNLGTKSDTIDNFKFILSNRPLTAGGAGPLFSSNNDFDCKDAVSGEHFFGYPYDGVQDECYDASGNPLAGRIEQIDEDGYGDHRDGTGSVWDEDKDGDGRKNEDPADDLWQASFLVASVANVASETTVSNGNSLSVTPFAHPLTRPGDYPVVIKADSQTARTKGLNAVDPSPSHLARLGAEDTVVVKIESFFDPQVMVFPAENAVKPGGQVKYEVEAVNGGNQDDRIAMVASFPDSDTLGCTMTTNGQAGCPYRALVTAIVPATWTDMGNLDAFFPATGAYAPLENGRDSFNITAPADWAGMQDTVYEVKLTATSTADLKVPAAKKDFVAHFTIMATKQSMARYLNLEIAEFKDEIEKANAAGVKSRGVQPVMLHPVSMMTTKALEQIVAGDLGSASKTLSSAIKVMEAVARMVNGAGLDEPLGTDWKARSAAILADMTKAQGSMIQ